MITTSFFDGVGASQHRKGMGLICSHKSNASAQLVAFQEEKRVSVRFAYQYHKNKVA
jgi:hypothetical protein